ncbi:hypothetical protein B0H14DRAFT_211388 [Mycena olivaceomarginata]|nr:hypothetical protein B0H14DRAFT_211388 [Mycena olivaceomarginata]
MRKARAKFIEASRHFPGIRFLNSSSASPRIFSAFAVSMISIFLLSKVNSLHGSQCGLSLAFLRLELVHQCKGMGIFCTRQPRNALGSSTSDVASEDMRFTLRHQDALAGYPHRHVERQRPRRVHNVLGGDEQRFLLLRVGEERLEAGADVQVAYTSRGPGGRLVRSGEAKTRVVGTFH